MKKAKALFAAGIIVVVAGLSAVMLYLNDAGFLHNSDAAETYVDDNNNDSVNTDDDVTPDGSDGAQQSEIQQATDVAEENIGEAEINEFLSAFANVYFAEQGNGFDIKKCSDYELIQFAYLHIRNTDKDSVILEQVDDSIVYYYTVSYEKVRSVVEKYFGVQISEESVYTENDYAFFRYNDGYFYTPAADGLAYKNFAVTDSVEYRNDNAVIRFTIYSGDEKYAEGEAEIRIYDNNMNLVSYQVYD